jgi:iron(III) transport system substrate-binding protein
VRDAIGACPHPNATKSFFEWLLSPDYARTAATDLGRPPRSAMPPLADEKVILLTVEEIPTGMPEVIEQWRDTFGS